MFYSKTVKVVLLGSLFTIFNFISLPAQEDAVTVEGVRFNREAVPGAAGEWLEVEIALKANNNLPPGAGAPDFARNIKARVSLAFEKAAQETNVPAIFQSEAAIVGIGRGKTVSVFFYLPCEAVKRDGLAAEPFAYLVELEVEGRALPPRAHNVSRNLADAARLENFKAKIRAETKNNAGVLVPIYDSPFYNPECRRQMKQSPAYIRPPRSG